MFREEGSDPRIEILITNGGKNCNCNISSDLESEWVSSFYEISSFGDDDEVVKIKRIIHSEN